MAIFNNSIIPAGAAAAPDVVTKSLRVASGSLSRTPASDGNQQKWTVSYWVKTLQSSQHYQICWPHGGSSGNYAYIGFYAEVLNAYLGSGHYMTTSRKFRDNAAWYHIVVSVDTTRTSSAADRIKLYINGEAEAWASGGTATLNESIPFANLATPTYIATWAGSSAFTDGYLADFFFIDGIGYAASDFAEEDATTGQWKPKAFVGVYGTNGFHLDFKDSSDIGKDVSVNTYDAFIAATGGTVTTDGDYKVHTFNSTGTFAVTNQPNSTVEYLVIAGGGGGAGGEGGCGGGGAGGHRSGSSLSVSGQSYSVTVGAGAAAQTGNAHGNNGSNSVFSSITSTGGGAGGTRTGGSGTSTSGSAGGSGGGAGDNYQNLSSAVGGAGTSGEGNDGGGGTYYAYSGSGGGGAGTAGGNSTSSSRGFGGDGEANSITGSSVTRAGGGGGGGSSGSSYGPQGAVGGSGGGGNGAINSPLTNPAAGTVNTGSGGGGAGNTSSAAYGTGQSGGSGCVIIRYKFQ
jgi:hypothetical protein